MKRSEVEQRVIQLEILYPDCKVEYTIQHYTDLMNGISTSKSGIEYEVIGPGQHLKSDVGELWTDFELENGLRNCKKRKNNEK